MLVDAQRRARRVLAARGARRRRRALPAAVGRVPRARAADGLRGRRVRARCSSSIMLTLRRREDAVRPRDFSWPAALLAAVVRALIVARASSACAPARRRDARAGARTSPRSAGCCSPTWVAAVRDRLARPARRARRRRVVGGRGTTDDASDSTPSSLLAAVLFSSACTARCRRRAPSWCSCRSSSWPTRSTSTSSRSRAS